MLSPDQITIWIVSLKVSDAELHDLELLLAEDEKSRANRYRFDLHRRRFIVARANLRIILSRYLHLSPQAIAFTYSSKGKPSVALEFNLEFNLAHSEDLAVCAVTWNSLVGIDLEYKKAIDSLQNLSQRFLSKQEAEIIQTSEKILEQQIFFKIWTIKEAYLKATGDGLGKLSELSTVWEHSEIIGLTVNQIPVDWMIYQFEIPLAKGYVGSMVSPVPKFVKIIDLTNSVSSG